MLIGGMNVKKFLAMLLTIAMLGGVLAGCGGGTTATPAPAETGAAETGAPAETEPAAEAVSLNIAYMPN